MATRSELITRLRAVGETSEDRIDLAETALTLAALDRPGVDTEPYVRHLTDLTRDAAAATERTASVGAQAAGLRRVLTEEYGYAGDRNTYDDTRNANLMHVIDRRLGLPVALGILYLHMVDGYGGSATGLNFPSHFLIRLEGRGQRAILDPFDELAVVEPSDLRRRLKDILGSDAEMAPDVYRAVSRREVLVRLQNNIKIRALAKGDLRRSLRILETLTALAPHNSEHWWELALVHHQIGNVGSAVRLLEDCLASSRNYDNAGRLEELLHKLKARLN